MSDRTELDEIDEAGDRRVGSYTLDGDAAYGSARVSTDHSGTEKPKVEKNIHAEPRPLEMLSQHYSAAFGPTSVEQVNEVDSVITDLSARINELVDNSRAHLYDSNVHPLAVLHDVLGRSLQVVTQTWDMSNNDTNGNSMLSTGDRVVNWAGSRAEAIKAVKSSNERYANDMKNSGIFVFSSPPNTPRQKAQEDDDHSSLGSLFEDRNVIQSVEHGRDYVVQNSNPVMDADDDDYREGSEAFQGIDRDRVSTPATSSPSCSPPPTPTPAARPRPRVTVTQPTPSIPRQQGTRMTGPSTGRKRAAGFAFKVDRTPLGNRTVQSEPKKKIQCLR